MKRPYIITILAGLIVILSFTNPAMDAYERYIHQQILEKTKKSGGFGAAVGLLFGGIASGFISNATTRNNYVLFSTYRTSLVNDDMTVLGIFGAFFPLREEKQTKPVELNGNIPKKQVVAEIPSDDIQGQFKVGPVSISTFAKCTPVRDQCQSHLVANYLNQSLRVNFVGSYFHPISDADFTLFDNRHIAISYETGGNCRDCTGIDVITVEGNKLSNLGRFSNYDNGYFIKTYTVLESNSLTSHANSQTWPLYYRSVNGEASLDANKTCSVAKQMHESRKMKLLSALSSGRKYDTSMEYKGWVADNVAAPLLEALALSRYCGWNNDYEAILVAAKSANNIVTYEMFQALSHDLALVKTVLPSTNGAN